MEEEGMVLNLHGEVPSDPRTVSSICSSTLFFSSATLNQYPQNTCVLNAERHFLEHLVQLHADFPKLRLVLEHATTKEAITTVRNLGPTVACTITAHHLDLIVDDWAGQGFNFCKPVAKYPEDRQALRDVVREGNAGIGLIELLYQFCSDIIAGPTGHPRFFLGSDSAPHPPHTKATSTPSQPCAAGVYTSPILLPLVAHLLESFGALDRLSGFASEFGRRFYGFGPGGGDKEEYSAPVKLARVSSTINEELLLGDQSVVPFWAGRTLNWSIEE